MASRLITVRNEYACYRYKVNIFLLKNKDIIFHTILYSKEKSKLYFYTTKKLNLIGIQSTKNNTNIREYCYDTDWKLFLKEVNNKKNETEKQRLLEIARGILPENTGVVIRTAE